MSKSFIETFAAGAGAGAGAAAAACACSFLAAASFAFAYMGGGGGGGGSKQTGVVVAQTRRSCVGGEKDSRTTEWRSTGKGERGRKDAHEENYQ